MRSIIGSNKFKEKKFISQQDYSIRRDEKLKGPKGWLVFYATQSGFARGQEMVNYYNANMQPEEINNTGTYKRVLYEHSREKENEDGEDEPIIRVHPDGETNPRLPKSVDGANVIIVSDPHSMLKYNSVNDDIVRIWQLIYTLKDHGASSVCLITPYLPYSRAERATHMQRETAMAEWYAKLVALSGADEIFCYHLHNDAVKSFYQGKIRMYPISGIPFAIDSFSDFKGDKNTVVLAPDIGAAKPSNILARHLELSLAITGKYRDKGGESEPIGVVGNFTDIQRALIFDDETLTFGTLKNSIRKTNKEYGINEFHACISHAKLTQEGIKNLEEAIELGLKKLYITNTIPQDFSRFPKDIVEIGDVNPLLVRVVNRRHYEFPVSELFR